VASDIFLPAIFLLPGAAGDEKAHEKALELIETEQDLKRRKKYAGLWR
jgi:hypothetical protein